MKRPLLRPLDFQPVTYQNQQMLLLRDPQGLSTQQLIMPVPLVQMLMFCDGQHTVNEIHAALEQLFGVQVDIAIIIDAITQLDESFLLENERSQQVRQQLLSQYRAQPFRPSSLADLSYPGQPQDLATLLQSYSNGRGSSQEHLWRGRGIISPHIDYPRGGPVYAQVWQRAATAVREADLVIILGTDHNGGLGTVTLTKLPYATPYGVLPTDLALIDELATAIGPDFAFADELHHRDEHSIELSAVWLHHIYAQAKIPPKPMVPILVGSFQHFVNNGQRPEGDARLTAVASILQRVSKECKLLLVASVDLAHVGPNFGDEFIMDQSRRSVLRNQDEMLMEAATRGDATAWYNQIAAIADRNRICGFAPTYLMLRALGQSSGQKIAYDQCSADTEDASLVSICGLLID